MTFDDSVPFYDAEKNKLLPGFFLAIRLARKRVSLLSNKVCHHFAVKSTLASAQPALALTQAARSRESTSRTRELPVSSDSTRTVSRRASVIQVQRI